MIDKIKKILFYSILIILLLPLLQMNMNLIEVKPLGGRFELTEKPDSITHKWFCQDYQKQYENYFNDYLGLRSLFVRINNQIKFSLFGIVLGKNTVLGKNNHLFQTDYIDAYIGYDYVGDERIINGFNKLITIQEKLKEKNIEFILIFAPCKASLMPANIPEQYNIEKHSKTNYEKYVSLFDNSKLNFIDLRKYFISISDTCRYPLYPINGAHWSGYGSTIASDTILKYISKLMNISTVKQYDKGGITTKTETRYTDYDLGYISNLFERLDNLEMYYPNIGYSSDSNTIKPNTLFIGDSYLQSFYGFYPYFKNCFGDNTSYWSYNTIVKWQNKKEVEEEILVRSLKSKNEILSKDLIVILISQMNIKYLDNLFTDMLYGIFIEPSQDEIDIQKEKIINNSEWFEKIKNQAKSRNISIEQMLEREARWYLIHKDD